MKLGKILGEGATAVTYEAEDEKGRRCCVKRYKTGLQYKDKEKIEREFQLLKKINHPQIPSIYGNYVQNIEGRDLLHVVQEMVDGENLESILKIQTLDLQKAKQILGDVLGILEYLHELSPPVIHRDIKPSNLMLRLDDKIVLIDFGQAIHDVNRTYGQTMVTGTLGYQAPEQIYGESEAKSDVYSLGVVAVELFTGKKPNTMLEGQVLRWERYCRHLPLALQEWLDGVLHLDIKKRWTAKKARQRLEELGDVLLLSSSDGGKAVSDEGLSMDFLSRLDDAILDEDEQRRKEREEAYRQEIEADRQKELRKQQEIGWKREEEVLWEEMAKSWAKLLSVVESGKISLKKGLEVFEDTFGERIQKRKHERKWGKIDSRIEMLVQVLEKPFGRLHQGYEEWVKSSFLNELVLKRDGVQKQIGDLTKQRYSLKGELSSLGWFNKFFKEEELQKEIEALEEQIAELALLRQEYNKDFRTTQFRYIGIFLVDGINLKERENILSFVEMEQIPKGTFPRGAHDKDKSAFKEEKPQRLITISQDYWIGKYPVTQKLWEMVMKANPSRFKGPDRPVENVSWFDCLEFCNKLSLLEGLEQVYQIKEKEVICNWEATGYRLPTEAEWEFAALAPTEIKQIARIKGQVYGVGGDHAEQILEMVAWFIDNSEGTTHPVGQKDPNDFGLHDTLGNVWEWCWDVYSSKYYEKSPKKDPKGPKKGSYRVERGGSWNNKEEYCRVTYRNRCKPTEAYSNIGLRLVRTANPLK